MKPIVPGFRPNQSARLKDIAEKYVPAKLKRIVKETASLLGAVVSHQLGIPTAIRPSEHRMACVIVF